jgi:outer membrane protein OmpA-like peptidoglycan-associated protein
MRKLALLSFFFYLAFSTCGFSQTDDRKALRMAEQHIEFDEYALAVPYLEEAVGINPKNAMSQFLLGKCLFETYQKSKALKALDKANVLNPGVHPEFSFYYAQALHYALRFDEAKDAYKRALALVKPNDPDYKMINAEIAHCEYGKNSVAHPVNARIENVGLPINTQWSEHSPVISADESVMIYTTVRPDNVGCKNNPTCELEDIYITYNVDGKWGTPKPISTSINTPNHDATIGLSADGQTLYIYKNPPGGGDLFSCQLKGTEWQAPVTLGSPVNSNEYETVVSQSPDGRTIFFTSERAGGVGQLDIYSSTKLDDGRWSEPVNLGPGINTPQDDDAPFMHANGKTLYFSSKGYENSIGGFDIYKTNLQADGTWSKPENLGYPINTPDNDIYFVLSADGRHGYYASARDGGYGEKDIYKIIIEEPKKEVVIDTVVQQPIINQVSLTILKGVISDASNQTPLEATIKVIDNGQNEVIAEFTSNSATGKYLVSLPSGKNYGISVECKDYLFHSENFDIPATTGYQEIVKDIALKKIKVGTTIVLKNIFFDYDKATLRPESVAELERLHQLLLDAPNLVIEIGGHTDSDGSAEYNATLSQNRAKSVVDYLVTKGISIGRLQAKGYGESVPIDTNDTPEGKQNNRRTEFKILKN